MLAGVGRIGCIGQLAIWRRNAFLLDRLGLTASAAYSTRRLRAAYTGPLLRVRRSSDNLEQDILATPLGDLDQAALLAFVPTGQGFVVTKYDQSGNGRHISQPVAANQPRIVNNGVIETINERPAPFYSGSQWLTATFVEGMLNWPTEGFTAVAVVSMAQQIDKRIVSMGNTLGGAGIYAPLQTVDGPLSGICSFIRNDQGTVILSQARALSGAFQATPIPATVGLIDSVTNTQRWVNGTSDTPVPPASARSGSMTLGSFTVGGLVRSTPSHQIAGHVGEQINFASELPTTEMQIVQRDHGAYYGITVA